MEMIEIKKKEKFSESKKEKIFIEFLDNYVLEKTKMEERENEVLIEKVKLYSKGKSLVIENTI